MPVRTDPWTARLLVIFILAFASIIDLIAPIMTGEIRGIFGIAKTFFILGAVFIFLQFLIKRIAQILVALTLLVVVGWLVVILPKLYEYFFGKFVMSVIPLYVSLLLLAGLGFVTLRKYDLSRAHPMIPKRNSDNVK